MAVHSSSKHIVVVGAGPVGLMTALRLAQIGISVTILELEEGLNTSPRAAMYSRAAVIEFDKAGILEDIRAEGFTLQGLRWQTVDGRTIAGMPPREPPTDVHRAVCIGQHQVGRIILSHLLRYSNATVLWSHRVVGLSQDREGAVVEVDCAEGRTKFGATYVVGADGAGSTVRKLLGLPFEGHTWPQEVVATNVRYPFDKYGFWDANFIIHPTHFAMVAKISQDGVWRCTFGEVPGLSKEEAMARLPEKYAAIMPGPKPPRYELLNISPYKLHQRCVPTMRVERVVLAGDAAHVCNPFGGMGLVGGLCDAGGLADCLVGILRGQADESILDRYAHIRRQIWQDVINPTSSSNICRLHDLDPEKAAEQDPLLRAMRDAEAGGTEAMAVMTKQYVARQMSLQYDFTQLYRQADPS